MIPSQLNLKFAQLQPDFIFFENSIATSLNITMIPSQIPSQLNSNSHKFIQDLIFFQISIA